MPWNTLINWLAGTQLTEVLLNAQLRDNLEVLKRRPFAVSDVTFAGNFTTTSTSFVDVSATWFSLTVTPSSTTETSDFMITSSFSILPSSTSTNRTITFDLTINGTSVSGGNGILVCSGNNANAILPVSFWYIARNVAPGADIFRLRWKTTGDTVTLYGQAGGVQNNRPQFSVMEIR
jgi:hypothetical protein